MLIEDVHGVTVALDVVGYQFPDLAPSGETFDWDANWLQIRATISEATASWSFTDPCMTTTEAVALTRWLRGVAGGSVDPDTERGSSGHLRFLEPNLSVRLESRSRSTLGLVWYFRGGSAPPGSSEAARYDEGHPVRLQVVAAGLSAAAADWESQLRHFPLRGADHQRARQAGP